MALQSRLFTLGFAAAALFVSSAPVYADIVLSVESVSAAVGSTGDTFDVLMTNTGPSSVAVSAFSFELQSSSSSVTFTGVTTSPATATYIFSGASLLGPNIDSQDSPTVIASDLSAGSTTVGSGVTYGLGLVSFDILASATPGPVTISFTGGATNSLTEPTGAPITINTLDSGTITVTSATVPEPTSFVLMLAGAVLLLGLRIRASRTGLRVTRL